MALSQREKSKRKWGLLFILPSFLILFVFVVYPLGYTFFLSFCKYNFAYDSRPEFQGIKNFVDMIHDENFVMSAKTTFKFAIFDFALMMLISLVLALIIYFKGNHTWFFRTSIFIPIVIPASLVCIIFSWLLSENFGLVNKFIKWVIANEW